MIAAYVPPETVFLFLLDSSGAVILFVYLLIGVPELVTRPKIPAERLRVRMWSYPFLTLLAIAAIVAVLVSMGLRGETRSQLILSLFSFAAVLAAHPLSRRFSGAAVAARWRRGRVRGGGGGGRSSCPPLAPLPSHRFARHAAQRTENLSAAPPPPSAGGRPGRSARPRTRSGSPPAGRPRAGRASG